MALECVEVRSGWRDPQQATSDKEGRFTFEQRVPDGTFRLIALSETQDGQQVVHGSALRARGGEVDVALGPLGACGITGCLQCPDPLPALVRVQLVCTTPELGTFHIQAQARDGLFRVTGLPPGQLSADVSWPATSPLGEWRGRATVVVAANRNVELTVPMQRAK